MARVLCLALLISLTGRAQEASPTPPLEWSNSAPEFQLGADRTGEMDSFLQNYTFTGANASVEPAALEEADTSEQNPVLWSVLALVLAVVLGLLLRVLYFDNVFGHRHHFPVGQAQPRLGGSYSGGLGVAVELAPTSENAK